MQRLISKVRSAIDAYNMIDEGDKVAVGVSGGKDSLALLCALSELRRFYPKKFDLIAVIIDPCFDSVMMDYSKIEELCRRLGVKSIIRRTELGNIIFNYREEKSPCSLCAKMRRGILHDIAKANGCNKVALGHHLDDAVETFFMNLFNCGNIGCFSPMSYLSRRDLFLIRPLIFCEEREITALARRYNLPIAKSKCPVDGKTQRQVTKELIVSLENNYEDLKKKVIGAMQRADIDNWGLDFKANP